MMDAVPGVKQNPLSNRVPHDESWLQLPPQLPRSQNPTFPDADRHAVPGALRHVAGPLYTVHCPPHTFCVRVVQYVTLTS